MNKRFIALFASVLVLWVLMNSSLLTAGLPTLFSSAVLALACVLPVLFWLNRGMKALPLFETFALIHLVYYWVPSVQIDSVMWSIYEPFRVKINLVVILFLTSGAAVYYRELFKLQRKAPVPSPIWDRAITVRASNIVFWSGLLLWITYQLLVVKGWFPNIGSAMGVVRALINALGTVSIFYLASEVGAKRINRFPAVIFLIGLLSGVLITFGGGFLINGAITLCTALFGYSIGSRRVPLFGTCAAVLLVGFLHIGKYEMRQKFWEEEDYKVNFTELYPFWIERSWVNLINGTVKEEDSDMSISSRANLLRMVGLVVYSSPEQLPFLHGQTYWEGLQLLVPSFLWKDRPAIHAPMQKVAIYYGLQTDETVEYTSISIGQIAEGWANFGWIGVAGAGAFFGWFFSIGLRLGFRESRTSVGYLIGMLFTSCAVNLEHFAGAMMMTFLQSAVVALAGLYIISTAKTKRSRPRPRRKDELVVQR